MDFRFDILASDDPCTVEHCENKLQSEKDIETENLPVENTTSPKLEITEKPEKYWNEYGGGLLWQSWQEKHSDQTLSSEPWNYPETKEEWEQHYSQIYWYYLEQFQYWEAQGWTYDASQSCSADTCTARTEIDNQRDEDCMKSDLISLSSSPNAVNNESCSCNDKDHNQILDGISSMALNSEEISQSQLDSSVSCGGHQQLNGDSNQKECPASGQKEPSNGETKESNFCENTNTDQPAQGKKRQDCFSTKL